jgi:hypothetical protein
VAIKIEKLAFLHGVEASIDKLCLIFSARATVFFDPTMSSSRVKHAALPKRLQSQP